MRTDIHGKLNASRLNAFVSFWMSKDANKPGVVLWPGLDLAVFPTKLYSSEYEKSQRFVSAKVVNNKILTPIIKAGETLKLTAQVEIPEGAQVKSAWIDLSSNKMRSVIGAMENQMIQIANGSGKVEVIPVSKTQVEVRAEFPLTSFTKSQELTLEQINFIYTSGDYSYIKPKFKEKAQVQEVQTNSGKMTVKDLRLDGGQILWPANMGRNINFNIYKGQPASVTVAVQNMGHFTHAILVGSVDRTSDKGINHREGFIHNFAAGGGSSVSGMTVPTAGFGSYEDGKKGDATLNFAVATTKQVWGRDAKSVHLEGIYLRDVNLDEIYIPFGMNFMIFLEN